MAKFKSDFLNVLDERGFIHQCSDITGLDALAAEGKAVGYIGFDCTAPSFHVGNMIVLMMLHWLQQTGNKPIVFSRFQKSYLSIKYFNKLDYFMKRY